MKMKSQRGAATLYVLIAMLFFTAVAIGVFITSANKQQMQLEAIRATQKLYDTGETASQAYLKYMGGEVIPISNASQLLQIGSGNTVYVEGKTYVFDTDKLYVLKDDITIQEEDKEKFIQLQQKLANGTVVIESQGYTISLIIGEVAKIYSGNDNFQNCCKINILGYVTNNLLALYDGIYNTKDGTNPTSTTWYDLVGTNNIILSGAVQSNKYIQFDGIDDSGSSSDVMNFNNTKEVTLELVDINNSIDAEIQILLELSEDWNNNNTGFGIATNEYAEKSYALTFRKLNEEDSGYNIKSTPANTINVGNINTYTFVINTAETYNNYIKIYKNGVLLTTSAPINLNADISNITLQNYRLYLCSRAGNYYFAKANLGSVRIYTRELTQTEIIQNYNTDQQRFAN